MPRRRSYNEKEDSLGTDFSPFAGAVSIKINRWGIEMSASRACLLPFVWLLLLSSCVPRPGGSPAPSKTVERNLSFVAQGRFDTLALKVGSPLESAHALLGPCLSSGADIYRHAYQDFAGVRVEYDYFNLYGDGNIITRVDLLPPFKAFGLTVGESDKLQMQKALGEADEHKFIPGMYEPVPYDGCTKPQNYAEYVCKSHTLLVYFNTDDGVISRLSIYRHDGPEPLDTSDRKPFYGASDEGLFLLDELANGKIPGLELKSGMACQSVRRLLGEPLKERAEDPWGSCYMEYPQYYVYYEPFDDRVTNIVCLSGASVFGLTVGVSTEEDVLALFGRPFDMCIGRFYALPGDTVRIDEHQLVYATEGIDLYFDTSEGIVTGIYLMDNKL